MCVFFKPTDLRSLSRDQIGSNCEPLILPKYNAALCFLDEGLANQQDMDLTCVLELGYPNGPIERVVRGGLEHRYVRTKALCDTFGAPSFAPQGERLLHTVAARSRSSK